MNLPSPGLRPPSPRPAGRGQGEGCVLGGSRAQGARPPSPRPAGRGQGEGCVLGGSRAQGAHEVRGGPSPRVVITGAGAVCGAGRTIEAIWSTIVAGRSAVAPITQWDAREWPVGVAAEVPASDLRTLIEDRRLQKMIARTDLFGLYAAGEAIRHSGVLARRDGLEALAVAQFNDRSGVFVGSGGGSFRSTYEFFPLLTQAAGDLAAFGRELETTVDPMWLLRQLPNNVVCHVGIRHGFKGANACITNQCVGGAMAVAEAAAALRANEAERAVAVGHDAPIEPETVLHYHNLGLLAPEALRPFDRCRAGTIFGEGAGAVMLEIAAVAQARGAAVLGELLGTGCVTEATGILDVLPDGNGLARAIELALEEAGMSPAAVGMVVAHGNGTRASDASEAAALRRVFAGSPPPVTSFKWALGHAIAASAALDLVMVLKALEQGVVPGIATLQELDPALAPLPVSPHPQQPRSDVALVCSRGFGGMNVALVVRGGRSRS
jgi:3-oxoacyl-[acyl-carrier-protein] synthase I